MIKEKIATGSCFCGAIRYSFSEAEASSSICHCGMCRKLHGSDYSTWVTVNKESFSIDKGAELVSEYQVSEIVNSYFCSCCGTKLYAIDSRYSGVSILRGTLISRLKDQPSRQWFWDRKVSWLESLNQIKKYSGENAEPVDDVK